MAKEIDSFLKSVRASKEDWIHKWFNFSSNAPPSWRAKTDASNIDFFAKFMADIVSLIEGGEFKCFSPMAFLQILSNESALSVYSWNNTR